MKRSNTCLKIGLSFLMPILILPSCRMDDAYDLSKKIDLTMALGTDGLAVTFGNTQKMYLRDILKVEDSNIIDTTTSGENKGLYYLIKTGSSSISTSISSITPYQIATTSTTSNSIYTATSDLTNANFTDEAQITTTPSLAIDIANIPSEIKEIHTVPLSNVNATIKMSISNSKFKLNSYKGLTIKFPDFIKSSSFNSANEYILNGTSQTITIPLESIEFPVNGSFGTIVKNNEIAVNGNFAIDGTVTISTNGTVNISAGETAKIKFDIAFSKITPTQITGLVSPTINPTIDPFVIKSGLPSSLQDNSVSLSVTNLTIKYNFNAQNIPVPLLFSATLNSVKNDQTIASANTPESGQLSVPKAATSIFYVTQTGTVFDPDGENASAKKVTVSNLTSLVKTLPDEIAIDLTDGKITSDPSTEHSITLDQTYSVDVSYEFMIPFQFDKEMKLLYTDSISNLNKDLKNYQADGFTISASAVNTIPLNMLLKILPYDTSGNLITSIAVDSVTIAAGSLTDSATTNISVKFTATTPADVSKVDKLMFKITASGSDSTSEAVLLSTQYVELKKIKIKLNGRIITNFN